jgi:hypothetical protein
VAKPSKEQKKQYIDRLVFYANKLGFGVDFESLPEFDPETEQRNPAGICVCSPDERVIYIRAGKKPNGVITSLVHEIVHAINRYRDLMYVGLYGNILEEWECESVAHYVTQLIGIDRRENTEQFVKNYIGIPQFNTSEKVKTTVVSIYDFITQ